MKKVNNKKGFTLAELLVVIAILAILIAIAVPIFTGTLKGAKDTVVKANFRAAESAAMVDYLSSDDATVVAARKNGDPLYYSYTVSEDDQKLTVTVKTGATDTDVKAESEYKGVVKVGG